MKTHGKRVSALLALLLSFALALGAGALAGGKSARAEQSDFTGTTDREITQGGEAHLSTPNSSGGNDHLLINNAFSIRKTAGKGIGIELAVIGSTTGDARTNILFTDKGGAAMVNYSTAGKADGMEGAKGFSVNIVPPGNHQSELRVAL